MPTIPYKNAKGERLSGVTTIIGGNLGWNKQALMYWANQEGLAGRSHRDTAQKAADAGTIGHYLIDCHIKGIKPALSQFPDKELISKGETCYLNFLEWSKMVKLTVHKTEINLVSEQHQYGATPDCIGSVSGSLTLIDWKTGNGVYADMLIQLAAYKQAWEENFPDMPLTGYHLLRIGKEDADFHHHHFGELSDGWEAFKYLLGLHNLKKKLEKRT